METNCRSKMEAKQSKLELCVMRLLERLRFLILYYSEKTMIKLCILKLGNRSNDVEVAANVFLAPKHP